MLWLMIQSVGGRLFAFASQLVLAWLLVPSDFGKISLAFTISNVTGALVSFGIDDVILHRRHSLNRWSSSGFYVSVGLGLLGMLATLAGGYVGAAVYHDASLATIVNIIALSVPLGALTAVPSAHIRAAMNFKFLATYNIVESGLTQLTIVMLAALGAGAYSFAIPIPIVAAVKAAVLWCKCRKISLHGAKLRQVKYLLVNGAASSGERLLIEVVAQCDYVLLGLLAPQSVVGLYFFAFRLAAQPVRALAGSFQNVLLAALAQLTNAPERQAQAAFRTARILAFAVMPFCFLQAALARPILLELFGTKWQNAIPLVQILSIGLPFDSVGWVIGALLKSRGQFKLAFLFSLGFSPIFVLAVAVGALTASAIGAALAVSLCYSVMPILYAVIVFKWSNISAKRTIGIFLSPLSIAAPSIGLADALASLDFLSGNLIAQAACILVVGSIVYTIASAALFPEIIAELNDLFPFGRRTLSAVLPGPFKVRQYK